VAACTLCDVYICMPAGAAVPFDCWRVGIFVRMGEDF
jgi:hypothetical protein